MPNHGTKLETLARKNVFGKFERGVNFKKFSTIVALKVILQKNVTRKNKIGRTNSKVLHM